MDIFYKTLPTGCLLRRLGVLSCLFIFLLSCIAGLAGSRATRPVSLAWFAKRYGFHHLSGKNSDTLMRKDQTLIFDNNSRKATYNGITIWLNDPVSEKWKRRTVTQRDFDKTIFPLITPATSVGRRGHRTVALDPGHGGSDLGAVGRRNVQEKRVVLDIARRTRTLLAAKGIKVYMTRTDDRTLTLAQRMEMVSRWKPDAFVSIHINAAQSVSASGIETHITPPSGCPITAQAGSRSRDNTVHPNNHYDEANMLLGYHLQRSMITRLKRDDRGVRRSRFFMTRNAPCPAALVECGFVSNRTEEELFLESRYRQAVAEAIAEGIMSYFSEVRR